MAKKKPVVLRSLKPIVGDQVYEVWVDMLNRLVPHGRTHRLAPLIAGMLQFALLEAGKRSQQDPSLEALADSLFFAVETGDPEEVKEEIGDLVEQLFADAKVKYRRKNSRGQGYSIIDHTMEEFAQWDFMPWE